MTTKDGNAQEYDAWNRMTKVTVSGFGDIYYAYNGLSQLISRINGTNNLYYYYNATGQVVEETDQAVPSTLKTWYVWGTQGAGDIVGVAHSPIEYYVQDAFQAVVARVDSSTGNVLQRYIYDAYETPKALAPNWSSYSFISDDYVLREGCRWLKDHGNYEVSGGFYDPELGVFLSAPLSGTQLLTALGTEELTFDEQLTGCGSGLLSLLPNPAPVNCKNDETKTFLVVHPPDKSEGIDVLTDKCTPVCLRNSNCGRNSGLLCLPDRIYEEKVKAVVGGNLYRVHCDCQCRPANEQGTSFGGTLEGKKRTQKREAEEKKKKDKEEKENKEKEKKEKSKAKKADKNTKKSEPAPSGACPNSALERSV
jgi:YD repeat-containing protein